MPKVKSAGVYNTKDYSLIEVFSTKAKAIEFQKNLRNGSEIIYYYHTYPSQVQVLGYAQAQDLENIIRFAISTKERYEQDSNANG